MASFVVASLQEQEDGHEHAKRPTPPDSWEEAILTIPFGSINVNVTISFEPPMILIQKGDELLDPQEVLVSRLEILDELTLVNFESSPNNDHPDEAWIGATL